VLLPLFCLLIAILPLLPLSSFVCVKVIELKSFCPQAIEAHTGVTMQELKLKDDDVLSLLKDVGTAKRKVLLLLLLLLLLHASLSPFLRSLFLRHRSLPSRLKLPQLTTSLRRHAL
jgi:hypothetical protein